MAFTQQQYDALNTAIAQGAKKVKYADKEVEYNSLDEMLKLRRLMESELGIGNANNRVIRTTFKKGLKPTGLEGEETNLCIDKW